MTVARVGLELAGRYRLKRLIGRGGMGEVWIADHVELGVDVAVKLLSPAVLADASAPARFRREARAAARLKNPHVVAVHDFGQEGQTPYLVMELLEGETLEQCVLRDGPLDPAKTVRLVTQACSALALAHANGIVHRDIKPSNLFLARGEQDAVLKVLDFGIARVADAEPGATTNSGVIVGSPVFMSPEQANGEVTGPESDLWSLSAVAYWALTGKEPFHAPTVLETLALIRAGVFPSPSAITALPKSVDDFFRKAFQISPYKRFASAPEFAGAFGRAVRGESVVEDGAPLASPKAFARYHTTRNLGSAPALRRRLLPWIGVGVALVSLAFAAFVRFSNRDVASPSSSDAGILAPNHAASAPATPASASAVAAPQVLPPRTPPVEGLLPLEAERRRVGAARVRDARRAATPIPSAAPLTATPAPAIPEPSLGGTDPLFGLPETGSPAKLPAPAPRPAASARQ